MAIFGILLKNFALRTIIQIGEGVMCFAELVFVIVYYGIATVMYNGAVSYTIK